jgi:uncharacterized protein
MVSNYLEKFPQLPYKYVLPFICFTIYCLPLAGQNNKLAGLQPVNLEDIIIHGDLAKRLNQNFNRLEEEKYQPEHIFLTDKESGGWPGDTEGRTILGLVMDARATGRAPGYLQTIIDLLPKHLNSKGYMGEIHPGIMDEQQLSGNGWMLRGLCEYYLWKKDDEVLKIIKSIANNLFVSGKGHYRTYPIDPEARKKGAGEMSGSIQSKLDGWKLSSDIGCLFIGMDGLIQAYDILREEQIKNVIIEMIEKFQKVDFVKIQAQTHATLTGLRGLIRYSDISGDKTYISFVENIWGMYKKWGMTENYENYNWFKRYDTWTEPCAIIDSYMLAVQLWKHTGNTQYLEDSELIYYNGIAHTQRMNGGFGCDNCPVPNDPYLKIHAYEAHWCCTMRGGEGLGRIAENSYFTIGDTLLVPFSGDNTACINSSTGLKIDITQTSVYPFNGDVKFVLNEKPKGLNCIKIYGHTKWARKHSLHINGIKVPVIINDGFVVIERSFRKGDVIELRFENVVHNEKLLNKDLASDKKSNSISSNSKNLTSELYKIMHGPLIMGVISDKPIKLKEAGSKKYPLTPVYHLMDSTVVGKAYKKQILFSF